MFSQVLTECIARLFDAELFYKTTFSKTAGSLQTAVKGMIFVELYAAYEYTVCAAVQATISCINSLNRPSQHFRTELLAVLLDSEIAAVADTHYTKLKWDRRLRLFRRLNSTDPVQTSDSVMPGAGGHFKTPHLETIWEVFGISEPIVPESRLLGFINELVDNRNAISHGRRTPKDVGRSYTDSEMGRKIIDTQRQCLYIIETMSNHCGDAANLCCR